MLAALVVGCAVFGLLIGSFLNVVIHRVPRDESVVRPRSRCPGCGTELASRDNIPVLSWLLLRGRCRTCAEPISPRYPIVELLTGAVFAITAWRVGLEWSLPAFLVFAAGLIALSGIDLDTYLLPRKLIYPLAGAGLVLLGGASLAEGDLRSAVEGVAGGFIGFAALLLIHLVSPRGMGFGDVRLAGLIGLHLGWIELPVVAVGLFLGFVLASVIGIALIVTRRRGRKDRVPFGPFLAGGALLGVWFGSALFDAYWPDV